MRLTSVLVLNTGSSSLKWVVLDAASEAIRQHGEARWEGGKAGRHEAEVVAALDQVSSVDAVGHRVVHGGARFQQAVLVEDSVRAELAELSELAPLHNPAALAGIDAAVRHLPGVPQVAAFDTAFHASLPEAAATYAIPWDVTRSWGIRKFGFHGLSVSYAVGRCGQLLGVVPRRIVVCHLGAGCSATAVADGHSIDTTMGFTPLEGLMMAQRSGSVDPGLLLYLMTRRGLDASALEHALNEQSGLLGVSGISADLRQVLAAASAGNPRAQLARDMFIQRIVSFVGGLVATLHGVDALVFTGGIGEHSAEVREAVCSAFAYLDLRLDSARNEGNPTDADVAHESSAVRVLVVTAREDLSILRQVRRLLESA